MKKDLKFLFRCLIVLSWLLGFGALAVDEIATDALPKELRAYAKSVEESEWTTKNSILMGLGIPLFIILLISTIGMFVFARWARLMFVVSYFPLLVLYCLDVPMVYPPIADFLGELGTLVDGAIMALAYFSPVAAEFKSGIQASRMDSLTHPTEKVE